MSKFRVGQRVRIKYSIGWPELAGQEGRIVKPAVVDIGPNAGKPGWAVAPDVWGTNFAPTRSANGANSFAAMESQLEPATDSYEVVSWKDCVWQPEHLRAEA